MSKKQLPVAPAGRPCARVTCETLPSALDRWDGGIKAATTDDNSISVFDVIGQDYWGEGVTAKRIAGALRAMNGADVTVNINSPGGDMFEGLAIYNLLREYEGRVTVKVLGIAASAVSVIAMAGDDIQIGRGAFLMIHNCWVYAMGSAVRLQSAGNDSHRLYQTVRSEPKGALGYSHQQQGSRCFVRCRAGRKHTAAWLYHRCGRRAAFRKGYGRTHQRR